MRQGSSNDDLIILWGVSQMMKVGGKINCAILYALEDNPNYDSSGGLFRWPMMRSSMNSP